MTHPQRPVQTACAAVLVLCLLGVCSATVRAADPLRVVLLVDSSTNMATMLTEFRAGLRSFIENIPDDVEVALISTGGQLRVRLAPTSDKVRMQEAASKLDAKDLGELGDDARKFIKDSPGAAIGIAAVAGFFLAKLFRGGSSDD